MKKIPVLIVDDHPFMQKAMAAVLSKSGKYEIYTAGNGTEALALAEQHQPDLVLMDISMPDMDGVETTKKLIARYPDIKVLIQTGTYRTEWVHKIVDAGAHGCILKNVDEAEFILAVEKVLKGEYHFSGSAARDIVADLKAVRHGQPAESIPAKGKLLHHLCAAFVILSAIITSYFVGMVPALILMTGGFLLSPLVWDNLTRLPSISRISALRYPVVVVSLVCYLLLAGHQWLKGGQRNPYFAGMGQELAADRPRGIINIDDLPDPAEMRLGKFYALIIGIDHYIGEWLPLQNAVNDAKAVENVLRSKYRFDEIITLYDERATRDSIIYAFEKLINQVDSNDNVLIYYSGHGEYNKKMDKGFWVPVDAQTKSTKWYLNDLNVRSYVEGIKSKHTLLIADACFSGDLLRGGEACAVKFDNSEKYYKTVYNIPSRQAISSGGIEPVMDGGSEGHSIFTYHLLKVLTENDKKFLDAIEVYNLIRIPIVNNSDQTPVFAPIKNTGDEGGQFLFINRENGS